jgi:hypothetical protein
MRDKALAEVEAEPCRHGSGWRTAKRRQEGHVKAFGQRPRSIVPGKGAVPSEKDGCEGRAIDREIRRCQQRGAAMYSYIMGKRRSERGCVRCDRKDVRWRGMWMWRFLAQAQARLPVCTPR